jgi:hypothetical protein
MSHWDRNYKDEDQGGPYICNRINQEGNQLEQEIDPAAFAVNKVIEAKAGFVFQIRPGESIDGILLSAGELHIVNHTLAPCNVAEICDSKLDCNRLVEAIYIEKKIRTEDLLLKAEAQVGLQMRKSSGSSRAGSRSTSFTVSQRSRILY